MSHSFEHKPDNSIADTQFARVIPCKALEFSDIAKWLGLGFQDMRQAPGLTVFFGIMFAAVPWCISYLVSLTGWHLVILPALVCFILVGPFLAAGLYDVSWELEKGHEPTFRHCLRALSRNAVNEWGFGILLMVLMIFWLRVASLIHALYPAYQDDSLTGFMPFLVVGSAAGFVFTAIVFLISAFTQPILMERRVDLATAVVTSINAVWVNKSVMLVWAGLIFASVLIGFLTFFVGFIFLMPLIGYASWHAYIDTIETKRARNYQ